MSPVAGGEDREVRCGPKGSDDGGVVELTEGGQQWCGGSLVGRRRYEAEEREEGGDRMLGHTHVREDERGKKKGCGGDGAPFIGDAVGGGGRATGDATRSGGAAWPAVSQLRRSQVALDRRQNMGGRGLTGGPPLQSRAVAV
jgi:hypothetical protein